MGVILPLICVTFFVLSVLVAATEAIGERDWPRETGKYVLIFGALTLYCFF
jgi:hypothetical protein